MFAFLCADMVDVVLILLGHGYVNDGWHRMVRHHYYLETSPYMKAKPDEHLYIVTGVLPICAEKIIRVLPKGTPA